MQQGYIKLYRKLRDNPLWKSCTPNRKVIMITMLLNANHKKVDIVLENGDRITILPGQFITSRRNFAKECGKGITEQMIRSAWVVFQKQGFSTIKTTQYYTLVTIENWGIYQESIKKQTHKQTQDQPKDNPESTTNKNDKNDKNDKNNIYNRVITRLNEKTSKNFKSTTKRTKTCIDARLKEGFVEEDFYKVIDIKCNEWLNNSEMNKYLRPETLFGNKFESYLNQNINKQIATNSNYEGSIGVHQTVNFKPRPQYIEDALEKKRKEYGLL